MTSEVNNSVEPTPEVKNVQENVSQGVVESQPKIASAENQDNWRKFREQREADRKAKEEADRRASEKEAEASALKAAMESLLNKQSNNNSNRNYGDESDETEEQRIKKHVDAALAARDVQYEQQRQQREREEFPQKLVQNFNDFNQVCNTENLDYLEYHYPEVSQAYKYMPDGYEKWQLIYKAVKKFVPNTNSQKDVRRAEANLNKPQSVSGNSMQGGSNGAPPKILDEATKQANWERMQRNLKGVS